jgi:uncharacterized protein YjbI with pentapeptide repeats
MTDQEQSTGQSCTYRCAACGESCCTETAHGPSGLCFLHDPDLSPGQREEHAQAGGSDSLKAYLEAKAAAGETLHGVRLSGAQLDGVRLNRADLRGATFNETNLFRARLFEADLRDVNFYNANLQQASLWKSNLHNACLDWADLRGARGLTSDDCRQIKPTVAGFRSVKRMFADAQRPDEAGEVAFWEKRQQRRDLGAQCHDWRTRTRWFALAVLELVCGYFERPMRPVICSALVILLCGLVFAMGGGIDKAVIGSADVEAGGLGITQAMYFSTVTFTTVGYGDFRPKPGVWRVIAAAESFAGAFLMAVFVVALAHRYVVR